MTPPEHSLTRATAPSLPVGVWSVDPARSTIGFAVKEMWGLRTVRGVFGTYDGRLHVAPDAVTGDLTIESESLDTGHRRRDAHLRSAAFFDVERHPRIVFTAQSATARGSGIEIAGDLVIGSARMQLAIPVQVSQLPDGALRLDGDTVVSRAAAGVTWNKLGMIGDDTVLHVQLTLARDDVR